MRVDSVSDDVGVDLDIVDMLKAWGDWQRSRSGSASAGTSLSSAYHEREDHGQGLVIVRDPQSEDLDKLVCQMGLRMGMFYQRAVVARYVWEKSIPEIAGLHGCSPALAKIRLQTAHAWLNGVVFGVRLRVVV